MGEVELVLLDVAETREIWIIGKGLIGIRIERICYEKEYHKTGRAQK